MMFSGDYTLGTIISAFVTFLVIVLTIRVYLNYMSSKRPKIQKPDWLEERERKNKK
ncbi:hypothetical protein [Helicobacter monodelphidis]|uniref:hypothetical protein n=1 Tax=Helicobacter sp. 15-1451 TaxID=2004995 RepID=UPI0015EC1061|nr:hypothetical protein [Helicobacter sp. 15-1451]